MSWCIALLLLAGLGAYIYQATLDYRRGPVVKVLSPAPYSTTHDREITIKGLTEHVTDIRLNGKQIFITSNGLFEEKLLLHDGYTIIKIDAEDRFGRHQEQRLEIFKI